LSPSRISSKSLKPSVVIIPTLAPFFSIKVLVATVVPCTINSTFASNSFNVILCELAISVKPFSTPIEGSLGVECVLNCLIG